MSSIYDEFREQKTLFDVLDENEDESVMLEELRQPKSLFSFDSEDAGEPEKAILSESFEPQPLPFWQRQFQPSATLKQRKFDWVFGVTLPLICFAFDPIVFDNSGSVRPVLGTYSLFAYGLSIVSIMSMTAWLLWGKRLAWLVPFLAGLFLTGSAISLLIGFYLLPLSLIGLIIIIGVLGFTPLIASFVYLRNSYRAFEAYDLFGEKQCSRMALALAALFSFVIPLIINFQFVDPAYWRTVERVLF